MTSFDIHPMKTVPMILFCSTSTNLYQLTIKLSSCKLAKGSVFFALLEMFNRRSMDMSSDYIDGWVDGWMDGWVGE